VPPEEELEHVVKPGETLGGIANRAAVPRVLIIEANHLKPPYSVHTGQKLALPRTRHHTVKKGETGFDIAYRYGVPFGDIAVANGMGPDDKVKVGQNADPHRGQAPAAKSAPARAEDVTPAAPAPAAPAPRARPITPIRLRLTAPACCGRWTAPTSTGCAAPSPRVKKPTPMAIITKVWTFPPRRHRRARAASGTVIFAGREPKNFGNMVVVEHDDGWTTAYGFLSKVTVKKGDTVTAHERVG
jgi:murein DD-endopeptidase MepM/ murein hydrolase activator NlpD